MLVAFYTKIVEENIIQVFNILIPTPIKLSLFNCLVLQVLENVKLFFFRLQSSDLQAAAQQRRGPNLPEERTPST